MEITPAILPKDFNELSEKISRVVNLVKTVQIDFCDGVFVEIKHGHILMKIQIT